MKLNRDRVGRLKTLCKKVRVFAYYMAGIPDYNYYVMQQRRHNPAAPVMTELEFLDYCHNRRNGHCC
ncbi:CstA-like transporter-associated (seleno)protein [Neisseria sp.]|uniref:CstA-like transporter-associated (seleno)protein n=1 Tax=Neisseria sp. TaxID=192066 RepID=UPI0026DCD7D2|nr:CstA-like transporter-associated (seleno)protein [Neisseria sp.]MDO4227519.1 CstA-like transporter-associated (seleno)protein [Neisseria sp.]